MDLAEWTAEAKLKGFPSRELNRKGIPATARAESLERTADAKARWRSARGDAWSRECGLSVSLDAACRAAQRRLGNPSAEVEALDGLWERMYQSTPKRAGTFFGALGIDMPEGNPLDAGWPDGNYFDRVANRLSQVGNPRAWMIRAARAAGDAGGLGGGAMRLALVRTAGALGLEDAVPWPAAEAAAGFRLLRAWVAEAGEGRCTPAWLGEMASDGRMAEMASVFRNAGLPDWGELAAWPESAY